MPIDKSMFQIAINEAVEKERRRGSWRVYYHYEFRHDDQDEAYVVAQTVGNPPRFELRYDDQRRVRVLSRTSGTRVAEEPFFEYPPLVSHRGLFLDFARLADDGEITKEGWETWIKTYGVLGLEQHDMTRYVIERHQELGSSLDELLIELRWLDDLGREYRLYSGSTAGGPRESYAGFESEAYKANRLLKIYEAATAEDELGNDTPDMAMVKGWAEEEDGVSKWITTPKRAKEWALGFVGHAVQEVISEDCYPLLHQEGVELTQGWGFHTLLGAMYLQLAWLMTSKEKARCKWCGGVITFEQPTISSDDVGQKGYRKPYKTRVDKEFCGRMCKDRWYYQNKTKPERERKRQGAIY